MSATNRGAKRTPRDFYATPESAFKPLLPILPRGSTYWEPACGDGRIIRWLEADGFHASGSDLVHGWDFFKDTTQRDFILTNPPFSVAHGFCEHALPHAREVMFLLPLNFLGSLKRRQWHQRNEVNALFPLADRPNFAMHVKCADCGHSEYFPIETKRPKACSSCASHEISISTSDSNEYAWFYWGRRFSGIIHL